MRSRLMLPLLIAAARGLELEPPKVHFKEDPEPPPPPVPLAKAVESSTADSRPAKKRHIETRQARRARERAYAKQSRRK